MCWEYLNGGVLILVFWCEMNGCKVIVISLYFYNKGFEFY